MDAESGLVQSELHAELVTHTGSYVGHRSLSRFIIRSDWLSTESSGTDSDSAEEEGSVGVPSHAAQRAQRTDADGDLVICRSGRPGKRVLPLTLRHAAAATSVGDCGLQVWRGACLLCDWLLCSHHALAGAHVLELGCGAGLASIAATLVAKDVTATDAVAEALGLAQENLQSNKFATRRRSGEPAVVQLDWFDFLTFNPTASNSAARIVQSRTAADVISAGAGAQPQGGVTGAGAAACDAAAARGAATSPSPADGFGGLRSALDRWAQAPCALLVAADTIYDTALNEAFAKCAACLLSYRRDLRQQQRQQEMAQQRELLTAAGSSSNDIPSAAAAASYIPHAITESTPAKQPRPSAVSMPHASRAAAAFPADVASTAVAAGTACGPCATADSNDCDGRLVLAVEKRYVFTLRDMAVGAPAFHHFMSTYVHVVGSSDAPQGVPGCSASDASGAGAASLHILGGGSTEADLIGGHNGTVPGGPRPGPLFLGRRLELSSVPKALSYNRSADLELWELQLI